MKKISGAKGKKSIFAALMAVLITVLGLWVSPVKAAPALSGDQDTISVLSFSVNVNTQTGLVESELILQNNVNEKAEVTFALPEISAGMDRSSLVVTGLNGKEIKANDGAVTLSFKAGGYAGLHYQYKAKKNLSYESTIAFDLKQLSNCFNDRIGHLEWSVDMQKYELVLVGEIHPINYTVADNRISVVLDHFLVTDLLNKCYVTRTTHTDLNEKLAKMLEYNEKRLEQETEDYMISGITRENNVYSFFVKNYRTWYRDPSFAEKIEYHTDRFEIDYTQPATIYKLYLQQSYSESQVRIIMDEIKLCNKTEAFSGTQSEFDEEALKEFLNEFRYFCNYLQDVEYFMISEEELALYKDIQLLLLYLFPMKKQTFSGYEPICSPAMDAELYPGEPVVYGVLLSAQPELSDKEIFVPETEAWIAKGEGQPDWDDPEYEKWFEENFYEYYITCVPIAGASWVNDLAHYSDNTWHRKEQALAFTYQKYRAVCILENDLADPEAVNDYLNALHTKAVFRSKYLVDGSEECSELDRTLGEETEHYRYYFGYEGTENYSYRDFCLDLPAYSGDPNAESGPWSAQNIPVVIHTSEPYAAVLSVPIITQYTGRLISADAVRNKVKNDQASGIRCDIDLPATDPSRALVTDDENWLKPIPFTADIEKIDSRLMAQPDPQKILQDRDDVLKQSTGENNLLLAQAREELMNAAEEPSVEETSEEETSEKETSEESRSEEGTEETSGEGKTSVETSDDPAGSEKETKDPSVTNSSIETEEQTAESVTSSNSGFTMVTPTPTPSPVPGQTSIGAGLTLLLIGVALLAVVGVVVLAVAVVIVVLVIRSKKKNV